MHLRPLPPSFLLPAWSTTQLHQLRLFHQSRAHYGGNGKATGDGGSPDHSSAKDKQPTPTSNDQAAIGHHGKGSPSLHTTPGKYELRPQRMPNSAYSRSYVRTQPLGSWRKQADEPAQQTSVSDTTGDTLQQREWHPSKPLGSTDVSAEAATGDRQTKPTLPERLSPRPMAESPSIRREAVQINGQRPVQMNPSNRKRWGWRGPSLSHDAPRGQDRRDINERGSNAVINPEQLDKEETPKDESSPSLEEHHYVSLESEVATVVPPTVDDREKLEDAQNITQGQATKKTPRKPSSLFEELFPEAAKAMHHPSKGQESKVRSVTKDIPRLQPPDINALESQYPSDAGAMVTATTISTNAVPQALRQDNVTVLLVSAISLSLSDADFRRIVPRGEHIEEWRGPGDIMRVIPGRDPDTLEPQPFYFLVFPNPAYARAYQEKVLHLHRLTSTYTPSSLESPIPPPPGVLVEGEDVASLVSDFALAAPSQYLRMHAYLPPYSGQIDRVLRAKGYPRLGDRAGRSVLFWVNGHQPSDLSVRTFLSRDGQDKGLQWGPLNGKGSIERLKVEPGDEDGEDGDSEDYLDEEEGPRRGRPFARWLIVFEDEVEARRFARTWHRRPYMFPLDGEWMPSREAVPLVHAEFLW